MTYEPPEYETQDFPEVADALFIVRTQYERGDALTWRGIDHLHCSISAVSPPPSWYFSPEGLEYMADRGHDFWDVYAQVAFQIGYHNGVMRSVKENNELRRLLSKFVGDDD
jgi:hypothetical protein